MSLSRRVSRIPESPLRQLADVARSTESRGRQVYYLNLGEPDEYPPTEVGAALASLAGNKMKYGRSEGELDLLSAWQKYFSDSGITLADGEMIITLGASEALLFTLAATTDPGDEILVFEPFYPNYLSLAAMLGVQLISLPFEQTEAGAILPSREQILQRLTPRTRAILFDNPSNPTGRVYTNDEMVRLGELAREKNLWLIADEVYRELVYLGTPTSLLSYPDFSERVVVVDSVSKRFSLCGCRIGCVVSRNVEFMAAIRRLAQSRLSAPIPSQRVAAAALAVGEPYVKEQLAAFQRKGAIVTEALSTWPELTYHEPNGSFYVFATVPKLKDSEVFSRWLVEEFSFENATVVIAPGTGFYLNPEHGRCQFRLAFVLTESALTRALTILHTGVQTYLTR